MNSFLKDYIYNLKERKELDWVICNLLEAKGYVITRRPFSYASSNTIRHKTEAEFGIDILGYTASNKKELFICILKDEKLTSSTWKSNDFQNDFNDACNIPLTDPKYASVTQLKIILIYNKDDLSDGIESYERAVGNHKNNNTRDQPTPISHERWNLDLICNEIQAHLYTMSVLPYEFNSLFMYISNLIKDIEFLSKEWDDIVIRNWKKFLEYIFEYQLLTDKKKIILINLTLYLLQKYHDNEDSFLKILDLVEWSLLSLTSNYFNQNSLKSVLKQTYPFYIDMLNQYSVELEKLSTVVDGLSGSAHYATQLVDNSYITYWHLTKIALKINIYNDLKAKSKKNLDIYLKDIGILKSLLLNNNSSLRPLIDLDHVSVCLIWFSLLGDKDQNFIENWFEKLVDYLSLRRINRVPLPFIESLNRLELVVEHVINGKEPILFFDKSSCFITLVAYICLTFTEEKKSRLLNKLYNEIIYVNKKDALDLMTWFPQEQWKQKCLMSNISSTGTSLALAIDHFNEPITMLLKNLDILQVAPNNNEGIQPMMPLSIQILGLIKNKSPLPSNIWIDKIKELNK